MHSVVIVKGWPDTNKEDWAKLAVNPTKLLAWPNPINAPLLEQIIGIDY